MKKYIIGNWKSHKTTHEGCQWIEEFSALYQEKVERVVAIAPTLISLEGVAAFAADCGLAGLGFAAQDLSPYPRGSYTGAVAADLLKEVATYAIVGHAERRRYFHETTQEIINKASEAADAGIIPLVCFEDVAQLSSLVVSLTELDGSFLLAYTPHDPVVARKAERVELVAEMAARVRRSIPQAVLLYGGAVTAENCADYLAIDGIAGLFVGAASLDAASFAAICNCV